MNTQITGRVVGTGGRIFNGCPVALEHSGGVWGTTITNADGDFRFSRMVHGQYTVRIYGRGHGVRVSEETPARRMGDLL